MYPVVLIYPILTINIWKKQQSKYAMIILLDFNVYIDEEIYYNYESSLQGWEQ
jgi:hypothetical protein